jgi:hypothetical protein
MDRKTVTAIVIDVLRELNAGFPSFIVQEDAEPDTVARDGYPFHVVFTDGTRCTLLESPGDDAQSMRAKITAKLSTLAAVRRSRVSS